MKKIIVLVLFLIGLNLQTAKAQSFTATVNRNPVPEGETFVLTLNLQDVDTQKTPDLSALSKDLTILSISNGYHTSIINGKVNKSREWNLVIMPNQSGEIEIPEIDVDGYKTQPIKLNVVSSDNLTQQVQQNVSENDPKFKMTGDVDNRMPFIHQQINYQLKIYDAGGLQGEAPFFVTTNDDWVIKNLGEPKVETKIINGMSLREIVFDYALFAQKSGDLTIPPVRFNGYYLSKATRTDPFARFFADDDFFRGFGLHDVFANKNQVVLTTKPIKVSVKPAVSQNGWWLPAEKVQLSSEFETPHPKFKVGEAINRTIYLKAVGVLDNQLPELKFPEISGMKQYPEKPVIEMKVENGKVVTLAKISNVYIPNQGGAVILPEIKINWFNTITQTAETAVIPEYKVYVAGNGNPEQNPTPIQSSQTYSSEKNIPSSEVVQLQKSDDRATIIAFVLGILLAIAIMSFGSLLLRLGDKRKKSVIQAAKEKNLRALRDELINWTAAHFPNQSISNLQDVADVFQSEELNKELEKIRETLYAETSGRWNKDAFLKVFKKISAKVKSHQRTPHDPLPKLYK